MEELDLIALIGKLGIGGTSAYVLIKLAIDAGRWLSIHAVVLLNDVSAIKLTAAAMKEDLGAIKESVADHSTRIARLETEIVLRRKGDVI